MVESKGTSPAERAPPPNLLTRQMTTRAVLTAPARDVDRRKMFLRKRSSRYGFAQPKIIVSPEEMPPRRLVLKMVDLQEELASVNKNIMSGLAVKPEAWDAVVDLVTRIAKNFREYVVFSWLPEVQQAQELSPPEIQQQQQPVQQPSQMQTSPPSEAPTRETSTDSYQTDEMTVLAPHSSLQDIEEREEASERPTMGGDDFPVGPATSSNASSPRKRISIMKLEYEFKRIVDVRDQKHKMTKFSLDRKQWMSWCVLDSQGRAGSLPIGTATLEGTSFIPTRQQRIRL